MDVVAINEAIQTLEDEDTTFENITELASLYIVRDHLQSPQYSVSSHSELEDVFPYYSKYVDSKRRYQLKQTTEGEVIQGMKKVCKELQDFIEELYSHTDMHKERLCIRGMLEKLNKDFCS